MGFSQPNATYPVSAYCVSFPRRKMNFVYESQSVADYFRYTIHTIGVIRLTVLATHASKRPT